METDGTQVTLVIADNGVGMNKTAHKHVFYPFFTTKKVGQGTGLGLAVAYLIITEKHGGDILCKSELGQGT